MCFPFGAHAGSVPHRASTRRREPSERMTAMRCSLGRGASLSFSKAILLPVGENEGERLVVTDLRVSRRTCEPLALIVKMSDRWWASRTNVIRRPFADHAGLLPAAR